ncbi:hypothetical protein [Streptomyces sp. C]|uniref:hypothetical protein n=1 Tax=Streptomyces sp. C TaxID=253839 RepID=UPI0001B57D98|nr:hypothetical protein [Streptomyces sp. C]EFL19382.1 predicted protein [Streptomyces sp. C]
MRAAVRRHDPRFLTATPDLAAALAVAEDDGRDLLEHVPDQWKGLKTWAKRFRPRYGLTRLTEQLGIPSPQAS